MTKTIATKAASALIALAITTTSFAEVAQASEHQFRYTAAELATPKGVAKVENRMRKFVRNACRSTSPLHNASYRKDCRSEMEAQIRNKVFASGHRAPAK